MFIVAVIFSVLTNMGETLCVLYAAVKGVCVCLCV